TEQMWFRSVRKSSRMVRRYSASRGEFTVTSMPSCTCVTHDATSLLLPFTSTRQRRQAPTSESPSMWHKVGTKILFSRATCSRVSSLRALTCFPSTTSVLISDCGFIRQLLQPWSCDKLPLDTLYLQYARDIPPGSGATCSAPDSAPSAPSRTNWCSSPH